MKKMLPFFLALLLVLSSVSSAFCEETYSEWDFRLRLMKIIPILNYDQLVRLNAMVQELLFEKGVLSNPDGVTVPPGIYTVGTDIPSGTYRIESNNKTAFDVTAFIVYDLEGHEIFGDILGYGGADTIGKVNLLPDNIVYIQYGSVTFFPYTGLFY